MADMALWDDSTQPDVFTILTRIVDKSATTCFPFAFSAQIWMLKGCTMWMQVEYGTDCKLADADTRRSSIMVKCVLV